MSDLKQKILAMVSEDLAAIETALEENLTPHVQLVREIASHILFSGGKRLRPLLMVLSARLCGYDGDYDKTFSTIFEYLHAATLLHDDLVDGASLRRGKTVAHHVWDNSTAVLTGDFLLARSLTIAAKPGNPRIIATIAWVTENMSQGEIQQLARKGDITITEDEYREVIRCKTAVLFQGACMASAQLAGASREMERALSDYGYHLGLAFQMADDLLDYTQDTQTLGKQVGADLREGKLTLPVIHALTQASADDRARMIDMIRQPDFSTDDFQSLVNMLHDNNGIAYTKACANRHVSLAKQSLAVFEPSRSRDILSDIADFSLARQA